MRKPAETRGAETDKRTSLIRKNILFSFLIKGWSALIVFLLVPLTLNCVGVYKNGIWMIISSMLVWIDNLDIGLGNGLRNQLAASLARGDTKKAREVVSSTFVMLFCIILPLCLLFCLLIGTADIYSFINADKNVVPDLANILIACTIFVCSTFVFKFIGNVYLGLQLPAVNNLLQAVGQTIALAGTAAIYWSGTGSLFQIALVNTAAPLLAYLISYPYTFYYKYPHLRPSLRAFRLKTAKGLFSVGVQFFIIQISGAVLFMSSNVLISRLFSPEVVTPYQIAYRYFYIPLLAFTIICTPYWSATTDAYERGDIEWIKRSNSRLNKIIVIIVAGIVAMTLVSRFFYGVWIGDKVDIPVEITLMMALFMVVTIISLRYSYVLNGLGVLRLQMITTVSAAIVFIPLAVVAKNVLGTILGFMCVMCAVNIPGMIINMIQYNKIINRKATGLWTR